LLRAIVGIRADHQRRALEPPDEKKHWQSQAHRNSLAELDAKIEADERAHQRPAGKRKLRERVGKTEPVHEAEQEPAARPFWSVMLSYSAGSNWRGVPGNPAVCYRPRRSRVHPGNVGLVSSRGEKRMRTILFAILVAMGIGFIGTSGASAAPVNGAAINNAAATIDPVADVYYYRRHYRGRYYGRRYYGGGCRRCGPYRCWWVC
jgi:hypothetical protein